MPMAIMHDSYKNLEMEMPMAIMHDSHKNLFKKFTDKHPQFASRVEDHIQEACAVQLAEGQAPIVFVRNLRELSDAAEDAQEGR